jgi:hypothetical protein
LVLNYGSLFRPNYKTFHLISSFFFDVGCLVKSSL